MIADSRRGSTAVELALLMPVILVVLFGVLEWGRFLTEQAEIVQVARDAAASGSQTRVVDGPEAMARARCVDALTDAGFDAVSAEITVTLGQATLGQTLQVDVRVPFEPLGGLVPMPSTLAAATTLRMQAP